MVERIEHLYPPIGPAKPAGAGGASKTAQSGRTPEGATFGDLLAREMAKSSPVSLSAHAARRLSSRGIELDSSRLDRLGRAVDRLHAKGGRDSLVMLDGLYLIVNVPSRTVVTAMEDGGMDERVVTNIDSAAVG
ncbi:MAG: flagellar biosynthesis protein [bacterium]|jgi:flagellar operon protein